MKRIVPSVLLIAATALAFACSTQHRSRSGAAAAGNEVFSNEVLSFALPAGWQANETAWPGMPGGMVMASPVEEDGWSSVNISWMPRDGADDAADELIEAALAGSSATEVGFGSYTALHGSSSDDESTIEVYVITVGGMLVTVETAWPPGDPKRVGEAVGLLKETLVIND